MNCISDLGAFFNWFSLAAIYILFLFLWVQSHAGLCCIELASRSFVNNVVHFEVRSLLCHDRVSGVSRVGFSQKIMKFYYFRFLLLLEFTRFAPNYIKSPLDRILGFVMVYAEFYG